MRIGSIEKVAKPAGLEFFLTIELFFLIILPPALAYLGLATSMAIGTAISGFLAIIIDTILLPRYRRSFLSALCILALILFGTASHLLLAQVNGPTDLSRGLFSLLPLSLCILGGWALALLFMSIDGGILERGIKTVCWLLSIIALLGSLGWLQPDTSITYTKPTFPFSEPSHLAITCAPFLIYICVSSPLVVRLACLLFCLIAGMFLENLTIIAVFLLTSFICLGARYIFLLAIIFFLALGYVDLSYYLERFDFSDQSHNLSALVYLQGWQQMAESFINSKGVGVGFQQLGIFGTNVDAADRINLLLGNSLNLLDGGFTLAKFVGEFGVLGVLISGVYLSIGICAVQMLRRVAIQKEQKSVALVFSASCIVGYFIELFLRGAGYFTPTSMLLVASLMIWWRYETSIQSKFSTKLV